MQKEETNSIKICSKCNERKFLYEFYLCRSKRDGRQVYCKVCQDIKKRDWDSRNPWFSKAYTKKYREKNRLKLNESAKNWRKKNFIRVKKTKLKQSYNITIEDFENMKNKQNNKCAICYNIFLKTPSIDHCHNSKKIRGLLCMRCNTSLGYFEKFLKNKDWTEQAQKYLDFYSTL